MNDDREPENTPNPWLKSLMVWGGIFLALLVVVSMFGGTATEPATQIKYSDFREKVIEGSVREVQIAPDRITGTLKNDETFSTIPVGTDTSLPALLEENEVSFSGVEAEQMNILWVILIQSLPFLLILGVAFFALRQVQKGGGAGGAMGFGKSKAKLLTERSGRVTFDDVAGIDEAGRGPLAGPVTAGAVVLPENYRHDVLNDSKKLTEKQRETLYAELTTDERVRWAAACVEPVEIDFVDLEHDRDRGHGNDRRHQEHE